MEPVGDPLLSPFFSDPQLSDPRPTSSRLPFANDPGGISGPTHGCCQGRSGIQIWDVARQWLRKGDKKTGCRWGYLSGYDGYVFHIYVIWIHMVKVIVLNIVLIYVLPSGNLTELWQITMLHR